MVECVICEKEIRRDRYNIYYKLERQDSPPQGRWQESIDVTIANVCSSCQDKINANFRSFVRKLRDNRGQMCVSEVKKLGLLGKTWEEYLTGTLCATCNKRVNGWCEARQHSLAKPKHIRKKRCGDYDNTCWYCENKITEPGNYCNECAIKLQPFEKKLERSKKLLHI